MELASKSCLGAVALKLTVLCALACCCSVQAAGDGFEDETGPSLSSFEFEDAEAAERVLIDDMPRNGFDEGQLDDEFQHSKEIETEIHQAGDTNIQQQSTMDRIQLRRAAERKQQLLASAALRWQRFSQVTPGVYELDENHNDGAKAGAVKDFEDFSGMGADIELLYARREKQPYLQPARTPFTVMWDDGEEVKSAALYAFQRVAQNLTQRFNVSIGVPVVHLPRIVELFLDSRSDGIHPDERAMADKKLLDFAHKNGIADSSVVISPVYIESSRFLAFLARTVHRLWAMREFRTGLEQKVQQNGLESLTKAEVHYLHLRKDLVEALAQRNAITSSQAEWVGHIDRASSGDPNVVPHPTVSLDEAMSGHLVRILEGSHEDPDSFAEFGPPNPHDYAKLAKYIEAKAAFYAGQ